MSAAGQEDWLDKVLLDWSGEWDDDYGRLRKDELSPHALKRLEEIKAAITSRIQQVEKAYGGCHLCYGKGYATISQYASSRLGRIRWKQEPIKYCTCDRGKQLEGHIQQQRADELSHVQDSCNTNEDEPYTTINGGYMPVSERISQLQPHRPNVEEKTK